MNMESEDVMLLHYLDSFIAILPFLVRGVVGTGQMLVTSTGLLIVVGTILDTMKQLEAQLLMRHYEGFIKK